MVSNSITAALLLFASAASAHAEEEHKIEYHPLSIGALEEFGQLGRGVYLMGPSQKGEIWTHDWIDHFGAFLTKEAVVDDHLFLSGGLGGIFQFRKPELVDPGFPGSQRKGFFIGPTVATAEYRFGSVDAPWLSLTAGMFPYKYNPDAANLGEYLYRSGAYPGYTVTGGYALINNTAAYLQGFKAAIRAGEFHADVLMTTETGLAPLYDWSLGIIADYSVAGGLLDLGAGVDFKRLLQVKPSRTSPHREANGYFRYQGNNYSTNLDYYSYQAEFYRKKGTPEGDAKAAAIQARYDLVEGLLNADSAAAKPDVHYYTNAGTLLMARASLDIKKLWNSEMFGPEDLKLYAEAALLGVKDYPVFYERRGDRIPVMAGFNLPGFRIFDLISVQMEYYKSRWLNNTSQIANDALPLPFFPIANDTVASRTDWNDLARRDDWKWSVLVQKKIAGFITLSGQVANDHLRMVSSRYYYGPQYDHNEITVSKDDWYWMTQISWGI